MVTKVITKQRGNGLFDQGAVANAALKYYFRQCNKALQSTDTKWFNYYLLYKFESHKVLFRDSNNTNMHHYIVHTYACFHVIQVNYVTRDFTAYKCPLPYELRKISMAALTKKGL